MAPLPWAAGDPLRAAPDPPVTAAAAPDLEPSLARGLLKVAAASCLAAALLLGLAGVSGAPAPGSSAYLSAAFLALAGAAAGALRLAPRHPGLALAAVLAGIAAASAASSDRAGLAVAGLLVCVLTAVAGWRAGVALAGFALLAAAGSAGLRMPGAAAGPWQALAPDLTLGLLALAGGLVSGAMISSRIGRDQRAIREREDRFRRLLALASDVYWEIDREHRLVAAFDPAGGRRGLAPGAALGRVPWELPQFACEADTLDELLADLGERKPFRDRPVRWIANPGRAWSFLVSGEPRFDEGGAFDGYWGVVRDVSEVHDVQAALVATESRYQELFARTPTPLVLHRGGRVLDANPAALTLFGRRDLADMLGADLLASFESGDSRERARRRMEYLQEQSAGTALPVTDFRLIISGRPVSVRATSVSVESQGGAALLAMFIDDTERLAAEEALRRSEALMAHLFATSPDLITLTDLRSGRYVMVNQAFERISGWSAAEAIGRSSLDLGVWGSPQARERFANLMREQRSVVDLPTRFVVRSGAAISLQVSAARFMMDRRDYLVINARDVTEKERERLQGEAILANASIGIAVTRDQRFVLTNPHFEEMYGWGPGELIGQPGAVVWLDAADYAEIGALLGPRLAAGEPVETERLARRRAGGTFHVRVRGRAIDPDRPAHSGTVWIVEDVSERREFEQALARARDAAESASRAKSAFLANTSHELRTPLNAMIGLALLARDEEIGEARRRQYLDQIAESAKSLAAIVSDILDLSKIEAGKMQLEAAAFDLEAELRSLERTYATVAAARHLDLRFEIDPQAAGTVIGDPLRVRQLASNFLANALKFTATGVVTVRARRCPLAPATVRLEVEDTGPGIEAATLERLFRPFTQADESTTRRFGGSGLGLSICRELAYLMGGVVGAESRPGAGSTFWAELPLPAAPAPEAAVAARGPLESLRGTRVLLAEDNPVNMMIAVAMLERWGVQVTGVQDGRAAIRAVQDAAARACPFDALLMDVQMPVMSGHEATRALRQTPAGRLLPIIALTAAALVTEREEALRAGMSDFLTKPIDAEKLRLALLRWCSLRP
jgi:PAS domain S-box-containing protein